MIMGIDILAWFVIGGVTVRKMMTIGVYRSSLILITAIVLIKTCWMICPFIVTLRLTFASLMEYQRETEQKIENKNKSNKQKT